MYAKIVSDEGSCTDLIQCGHVQVREHPTVGGRVMVSLHGTPANALGEVHYELVKGEQALYVLDDHGHTVDSYRWPRDRSDLLGTPATEMPTGAQLQDGLNQKLMADDRALERSNRP